jgi:cAMP-binding proteins - catabolite gene activator and regulatory subunit of cAMP-dependent protein kinases
MKNCTYPCTSTIPIFQSLSYEELVKIASIITQKKFKKGEILVHEGEKSDTLFIIRKGRIKLLKITIQGKEQILNILTNGDFFGELNIFNMNAVANFSAHAMESIEVCMLEQSKMNQIILENPSISLKLLKTVTARLVHTENLVLNLATKNPEIRVVNMILDFCEKYGTKTNEGIVILLPLNREEMANYIGVTRETITRKLKMLKELELIETVGNKKLIVKDEIMLRSYVE